MPLLILISTAETLFIFFKVLWIFQSGPKCWLTDRWQAGKNTVCYSKAGCVYAYFLHICIGIHCSVVKLMGHAAFFCMLHVFKLKNLSLFFTCFLFFLFAFINILRWRHRDTADLKVHSLVPHRAACICPEQTGLRSLLQHREGVLLKKHKMMDDLPHQVIMQQLWRNLPKHCYQHTPLFIPNISSCLDRNPFQSVFVYSYFTPAMSALMFMCFKGDIMMGFCFPHWWLLCQQKLARRLVVVNTHCKYVLVDVTDYRLVINYVLSLVCGPFRFFWFQSTCSLTVSQALMKHSS